ncbi:hypothetical protein [Ferrimonas marina]|uniref:Uncharacterized protein n=1 Tax=Ferrimonas marina TaxID=299255 RepID=A0A1M5ZFY2_9GAMM|nr:hypothetical protein [Ferrimonas marina]SHI23092.1 hypothetical protein SAMN02745129_0248 [Ferrimonas marina]
MRHHAGPAFEYAKQRLEQEGKGEGRKKKEEGWCALALALMLPIFPFVLGVHHIGPLMFFVGVVLAAYGGLCLMASREYWQRFDNYEQQYVCEHWGDECSRSAHP